MQVMFINTSTSKLIPVLLHSKVIDETQLNDAIRKAQIKGQTLLTYILKHFAFRPDTLSHLCAEYFGLEHRALNGIHWQNLPLEVIDEKLIQKHPILPIHKEHKKLYIAVCNPDDFTVLDDIQYHTGLYTQAIMAPHDQITALINQLLSSKYYANILETRSQTQTPAVSFVEKIITDAIHRNASDIHCEPLAEGYRVRLRIDGLLHEIAQTPAHLADTIISRLKILAQCDIAEKRLPQDGRFSFTSSSGQSRDCRLSSCPTLHGEKIVLRLLEANKQLLNMNELGLSESDQQMFCRHLSQPQGLILVTGPTGSGKTVTLYTALEYLNRKSHNISTVEEPIEIQIPGINQVNVNEKAGLTFSNVLRALLRQDPDIIMVGEIRDKETAEIAIRAAQTGHLVLSTLHTNSAADTLIRLLNMGIASYNLASSLRLIIAQRLIRKLCSHCKNHQNESKDCRYCLDGYHGREAVFEMMPVSKSMSNIILTGTRNDIIEQAKKEGLEDLMQAGLKKVAAGTTSLTEIYRVISHE
jgi:type IV pilus assembly protein PilB